jgi:predicted Zn-dependent protease with MMP-like domain
MTLWRISLLAACGENKNSLSGLNSALLGHHCGHHCPAQNDGAELRSKVEIPRRARDDNKKTG